MKYRSFYLIICGVITTFVVVNFILWKLYTQTLLNPPGDFMVGDLARTGYVLDVAKLRKEIITLPKRYIDGPEFKGEKVDILTLGDSFSIGSGNGENPYYQDYMASKNNIKVLNVYKYKNNNLLTTLCILMNSGWLEKYKIKRILLECAERFCINEFGGEIDIGKNDSIENIQQFLNKYKRINRLPNISFINTGNYKYLIFNLLYNRSNNLSGSVTFSGIVIRQLNEELFSGNNGTKFLCLIHEITSTKSCTDDSVNKMNDNINLIANLLKKKEVKLFFMPVVGKYNLYSDKIINNNYPNSCFFEILRQADKDYIFIDTKEILKEAVSKGEKDIFWQDDSHWTFNAIKIVFNNIRFE